MKQVTTFNASEVVAAVALYNSAVRAIGDQKLKQLTVKSVLDMVRESKDEGNEHVKASINVTLSGDIVVTYEIESEAVLRFSAILEKYVAPIISIGKGVWGLMSGLKPLMKGLEYDLNTTFAYGGSEAVVLVSASKNVFKNVETEPDYEYAVVHVPHGADRLSDFDDASASAVKAVELVLTTSGKSEEYGRYFEVHFDNDKITKVVPRK